MDDPCDKTEKEKIQNAKRAPCENVQTMRRSFRPMRLTSGGRLGGCRTGLGFRGEEGEPGKWFFTSWNIAGFIFEFCIAEKKTMSTPVWLSESVSASGHLGTDTAGSAEPADCRGSWRPNQTHKQKCETPEWDKRGSFPLIICPCFKPPPLWAPWPASRSPPLWWSIREAEGPKVSGMEGEEAAAREGTGSDWSPAPGRLNGR